MVAFFWGGGDLKKTELEGGVLQRIFFWGGGGKLDKMWMGRWSQFFFGGGGSKKDQVEWGGEFFIEEGDGNAREG